MHNAGVLPATRTETGEGHEITLATDVLGPVLLTELLLPVLANSPDPRVIFVSLGGMYTQALPAADPETAMADTAAPSPMRARNG